MKLSAFQIGVIGFFAIAALAGLFVFATSKGFGGKKDQVGTVLIWGTLPNAAISDALAEISSADSQYAKVTYEQKPEANFSRQLADALASGGGPDAVIIDQEDLMAEVSKLRSIPFTSIPKRTILDTYLPEFELFLIPDGTYGVPLVLDPLVLYWNRTTLGSAGAIQAPATWEAVAGLAPSITKRTDAGAVTKSLIPLGGYANIGNARAIISLLLLQAGTPITTTDASGVVRAVFGNDANNQFGTTPAQSAVNFYAQFADPAKTVYSWNPSLREAAQTFVTGDTALYLGFASERKFLTESNPNLDFDMAPTPIPGTMTARMTYGKAYVVAITKGSKNPGGAYLAATALSGAGKKVAAATGMAPAKRSDLVPAAADSYEAVFYPEALVAKGWLSPSRADTDSIFSAMISNVITGRKTIGDAVSTAAQALSAALR